MTIQLGNIWYILSLLIGAGAVVGLYYLLRRKSDKTKFWVLFGFVAFNLALHFLKSIWYADGTSYSLRPYFWAEKLFMTNLCGVSVFFMPFILLTKNKYLRDAMFYIGTVTGFLAFVYPDAIGWKAIDIETTRFYITHWIISAIPLLMVLLKVHTLDWRRVWAVPLFVMLWYAVIILNQVISVEMGIEQPEAGYFLGTHGTNNSTQWNADSSVLGQIYDALTPHFLKVAPMGPHAGETHYWALLWLIPSTVILWIPVSFGLSMIWDAKNFRATMKKLFTKMAHTKT